MDPARDCAARSTNPSVQLSRVERHKHYDGIRVRINAPVSAYDDAPGPCNSENNHQQLTTKGKPQRALACSVSTLDYAHHKFAAFFGRCRKPELCRQLNASAAYWRQS